LAWCANWFSKRDRLWLATLFALLGIYDTQSNVVNAFSGGNSDILSGGIL
jgi:hypothetical protein